jgi:hypothetical protein
MRRVTLLPLVCLLVQNCTHFLITRTVPVSENFTEHKICVLRRSANLSRKVLILKTNSESNIICVHYTAISYVYITQQYHMSLCKIPVVFVRF